MFVCGSTCFFYPLHHERSSLTSRETSSTVSQGCMELFLLGAIRVGLSSHFADHDVYLSLGLGRTAFPRPPRKQDDGAKFTLFWRFMGLLPTCVGTGQFGNARRQHASSTYQVHHTSRNASRRKRRVNSLVERQTGQRSTMIYRKIPPPLNYETKENFFALFKNQDKPGHFQARI